ncbi:hypothetical protein HMPREF2794_14630 [Bacteroides sp. HMSC067B03]|nr:hypothetical protein HMPREF2794_14630 [Bacteroides sp. HMSC067B03]RGU18017.1 hypothetical protein DWW93_03520 [Bacteroides faecis]
MIFHSSFYFNLFLCGKSTKNNTIFIRNGHLFKKSWDSRSYGCHFKNKVKRIHLLLREEGLFVEAFSHFQGNILRKRITWAESLHYYTINLFLMKN